MKEILTQIPATEMAIGYAAGYAADFIAARKIAGERKALARSHQDVAKEGLSLRHRLGRSVIGPLAIFGAATGAVFGLAENNTDYTPPHLEVVVDHSGATATGEMPITQIDAFIEGIADSDENMETQAIVARLDESRVMSIEDVDEDEPFGNAPLNQSVHLALDHTGQSRVADIQEERDPSYAVMAVTNGNEVADGATMQRAIEMNVPIYVVNVEESVANPAVQSNLQSVAEQTGGDYWSISKTSPRDVLNEITDDLTGSDKDAEQARNYFLLGLGGLMVGGLYRNLKRARNEPLTDKGLILPKEEM